MNVASLVNLLYIPRAMWNALRMSGDERARRVMSAFVARDVYDAGMRLFELAGRIGGEFENETHAYIREHGILEVTRVWELEEANELRDEVAQRLAEAQQRLNGGE
jgi:hypothetical protein